MTTPLLLKYDFTGAPTASNTIQLALSGSFLTIDWGDGTTDPFTSPTVATVSHTYSTQIVYDITISGSLLSFGDGASAMTGIQYLTRVDSFSDTLTNLSGAFFGASSLTNITLNFPIGVTDISYIFGNCTILNDSNISNWDTINVTDMSYAFFQASSFNQSLGGWRVGSVTTLEYMFYGALAFNNGNASGSHTYPLNWNTTSVTSMRAMFRGATSFNSSLSYFVGSSVTDMTQMFEFAYAFNDPSILTWDVSSVTDLSACFHNADSFNQDLGGWNVSAATTMTTMFDGCGLSTTNFDSILNGWGSRGTLQPNVTLGALNLHYTSNGLAGYNQLTSAPNNWTIVGAIYDWPCLGKDTEILCQRDDQEVYVPIQDLRRGDLVKTSTKGFIPVFAVGHSLIRNDPSIETPNRLYICDDPAAFPMMTRPLILTGFHSLLYDSLTRVQQTTMLTLAGKMLVTENKYRLYACADERVRVLDQKGEFDIYHLALENADYYMNYGIYANGILVESCSKRYLMEYSRMDLLV